MSKVIQRCSIAILIQGLFVIAFQIATDGILRIDYVANYVAVINCFLSLLAGLLGFYYANTKELKIICMHVIVLVMVSLLYFGFAVLTFLLLFQPKYLKKRVRILVQGIFEASRKERTQTRMDTIQSRLYCCGVNGITDYGIYYPPSCCAPPGLSCSLTNDNVYTRGCAYEAYSVIYHAQIIYTIVMIVFMVGPVVATIYMAKQLRRTVQMVRCVKRDDHVLAADDGQVRNCNRDHCGSEDIQMEAIDLD